VLGSRDLGTVREAVLLVEEPLLEVVPGLYDL